MLPKRRSRECSRFAGGQERGLSSCRIDLTASRPIQPRAAPLLRRAPPRPDPPVVCPGFGFDKSVYIGLTCLFLRMSFETFFDALGCKRVRCVMIEANNRLPIRIGFALQAALCWAALPQSPSLRFFPDWTSLFVLQMISSRT